MSIKKAHLKIFADKPEFFSCFPGEVLDGESIGRLRLIPRLAVAEIAGPADVEPLRKLLARRRPDGLVPTISYTGAEFGSWEGLLSVAADLKSGLEKNLNIYTAAPVILGAPSLWRALLRAHEEKLAGRFGFARRCLGCRLYGYMLRVPLCKQIDAGFYIPSCSGLGQRGCPAHSQQVEKKYFGFLMSGFGIEVWHQAPGGAEPGQPGGCPCCALGPEPPCSAAPQVLERYFESFALPAAGGVLSRAVFGAPADYDGIISQAAQPKSPAGERRKRQEP